MTMTTRAAARALNLKPVTVRRAFYLGLIEGRQDDGPGSTILLDEQSVEVYRRRNRGFDGPLSARCAQCGIARRDHDQPDHDFTRRRESYAAGPS